MTQRPPWRAADIADAILGRSTQPPLPAADSLPGVGYGLEIELDSKYNDALVMIYESSDQPIIIIWPVSYGIRDDH